ncbi:hypothetical protein QT654_20650 [Xanthomonas citri pv. citri]
MDDFMGPGRVIGMIGAAATAGATAVEVVTKTETVVLNIPLSMLLVAIAGTMIGFFILPSKDAARISPNPGATRRQRVMYVVFSLAIIGAAVIAYAIMSAWIIQAGVSIIATVFKGWRVEDGAIMPCTGLVGIGIRLWLPTLLKAVERRADRVIGGSP